MAPLLGHAAPHDRYCKTCVEPLLRYVNAAVLENGLLWLEVAGLLSSLMCYIWVVVIQFESNIAGKMRGKMWGNLAIDISIGLIS